MTNILFAHLCAVIDTADWNNAPFLDYSGNSANLVHPEILVFLLLFSPSSVTNGFTFDPRRLLFRNVSDDQMTRVQPTYTVGQKQFVEIILLTS